MSGIAPHCVFHVCIIHVNLTDRRGGFKSLQGTGFWLEYNSTYVFITNEHNVDPKIKLGKDTNYAINGVEIEITCRHGQNWLPGTVRFDLQDYGIRQHPTADVAIIENIDFSDKPSGSEISYFLHSDIADQQFLQNSLHPMDVASFIGFPGKRGVPWYDSLWKLAIARAANIASLPGIPFTNPAIPTTDTMLVSGLSFSGSSGSPVISHQKGVIIGPGLSGPPAVMPRLIGIMSEHWNEDEKSYEHSGLSYLTRSTAILELLP